MQRTRLRPLMLPFLLIAFGSLVVHAEPDEKAFKDASKAAGRLMKKAGAKDEKLGTIKSLAADNSKRAVELLLKWAEASHSLLTKKLEPKSDKSAKAYEKQRDKAADKHGNSALWPEPLQKRVEMKKVAAEKDAAAVRTELDVAMRISEGVARTTNEEAATWMASTGLLSLLRKNGPQIVPGGCVALLLANKSVDASASILKAAQFEIASMGRVRSLEWIGSEALPGAAKQLGSCLFSNSILVRRTVVRTWKKLDDLACVPLLIKGLAEADGLLSSEIIDLLHHFTGLTLGTDAKPWRAWWSADGKAWLEAAGDKRHGSRPSHGDVGFYGITTPSNRIVFVLDRSGSMIAKGKDLNPKKGPTTGDEKDKEEASGTMLDLAKQELRRSINKLDPRVRFNVVFYNSDVQAWKAPPSLHIANPENKQSARNWFMPLKPIGSTALFDSLHKALEYASKFGNDPRYGKPGADTIFLLSDGAPTKKLSGAAALTRSPPPLSDEEIEAEFKRFMSANEIPRCVVHTIGLGPGHKRELMQRLAQATGGTYVAIGAD